MKKPQDSCEVDSCTLKLVQGRANLRGKSIRSWKKKSRKTSIRFSVYEDNPFCRSSSSLHENNILYVHSCVKWSMFFIVFFFPYISVWEHLKIHGFILSFAKPSSVACITFISAADITTYPALLQMQKQQYNLPLLALIIVSLLNANHSKGWNLALILHCSY